MASHEKSANDEANPKSVPARLSVGMMPFFIPPPTSPAQRSFPDSISSSAPATDLTYDPTLMTPPMSPTESSFNPMSIEGRFASSSVIPGTAADTSIASASSSSSSSAHYSKALFEQEFYSPRTDVSVANPVVSSSTSARGPSASALSAPLVSPTLSSNSNFGSILDVSPRPLSFHWDDYRHVRDDQDDFDDDDDDDDDDDEDGDDDRDDFDDYGDDDRHVSDSQSPQESYYRRRGNHPQGASTGQSSYHQRFEGHHAIVRRSSYGGHGHSGVRSRTKRSSPRRHIHQGSGSGGGMNAGSSESSSGHDQVYDSLRHGLGLTVADMSDELAKAKSKMSRANMAMKTIEIELDALQMGIEEHKESSANARSAIEENFWKLECLALSLEQDRQDINRQLQDVNRECGQVAGTITNWEVRIDWLGQKVDNTSEFVSELVLSEQECMSFVKMIIQQNRRYAMPAISKATERNIRMLAPPMRVGDMMHPSIASMPGMSPIMPYASLSASGPSPLTSAPEAPTPTSIPAAPIPQPSIRHIPISWLLDPIVPPNPAQILQDELEMNAKNKRNGDQQNSQTPTIELWRDFSRLTTAMEKGQMRTPYTPFQRTRSCSTGQGSSAGSSTTFMGLHKGFGLGTGIGSGLNVGSSGSTSASSTMYKPAVSRRPQAENLAPLPKILPATVPTNQLPAIKRRSQNLNHLPMHSWLKLQFNRTVSTPGLRTPTPTSGHGTGRGGAGGAGRAPGPRRTSVLGFKPVTIFQTTV